MMLVVGGWWVGQSRERSVIYITMRWTLKTCARVFSERSLRPPRSTIRLQRSDSSALTCSSSRTRRTKTRHHNKTSRELRQFNFVEINSVICTQPARHTVDRCTRHGSHLASRSGSKEGDNVRDREGRLGVRDCGRTRRAAGTMRKDAAKLSNVSPLNSTFRTKLYESARS